MKRIAAILLCLILLFGFSLAVFAEDAPTEAAEETADAEEVPAEEIPVVEVPTSESAPVDIATVQDLQNIALDPSGSYRLTCDIDLSNIDWVPLAFSGKLDGNGFSLYNLKITQPGATTTETFDGNDKEYFTYGCGLFSILTEAEIRNLSIRGEQITAAPDDHCFVGGLAGIITKSKLDNCSVTDARITLEAGAVQSGVGGLVGYAAGGLVSNCTANTVLVFIDRNGDDVRCEEFLGGAVASGYVTVDSCNITLEGYCSCHGYVHNGGLMGMFDVPKDGSFSDYIARNTANGVIQFYENNPDRRAYCEPFCGELLTYCEMFDNVNNFTKDEVFDYTVILLPEKCANATLITSEVAPGCDTWGYTNHRCSVCGHEWNDCFIPPVHMEGEWEITQEATLTASGKRVLHCAKCDAIMATEEIPPHVMGDWVTITEPDYGKEGLRECYCADCGELLHQEFIPALKPVESITLSADEMELQYKVTSQIIAWAEPTDAANNVLIFSSTNPDVLTVDTDGTLHAVGRGEADIVCTSGDGFASATCHVTVKYSAMQWVIRTIAFGWIWY